MFQVSKEMPMLSRPFCFVVMPFSKKKDPSGGPDIDFDAIYELAIRPAVNDTGMTPVRADEERIGGIIHKPMFERLILCDYAVADLATANPTSSTNSACGMPCGMRPRSHCSRKGKCFPSTSTSSALCHTGWVKPTALANRTPGNSVRGLPPG
jgi:hypothetical protein